MVFIQGKDTTYDERPQSCRDFEVDSVLCKIAMENLND